MNIEDISIFGPGADQDRPESFPRSRSPRARMAAVVLAAVMFGAGVGAAMVLGFKPTVPPTVWVGRQ